MTTFNNNFAKNTKFGGVVGVGSDFEIDSTSNELAIMQDMGGASLEKTFSLTPTGAILLKSLHMLYDGTTNIEIKWEGSGDVLMSISPDGVMIPNQVFETIVMGSGTGKTSISEIDGKPSILYWPNGLGDENEIIFQYEAVGGYTVIKDMVTGVGNSAISHTIGGNSELTNNPTLYMLPNDSGTLPNTIYAGSTYADNIIHTAAIVDTDDDTTKYRIDFKGDKIQYVFNPGEENEVIAVEIDSTGVVIGGGSLSTEIQELIENLADIFTGIQFQEVELENEEIVNVAVVPAYWFAGGHIGTLGYETTGGKVFISQIDNPNIPTLVMEKTGVEEGLLTPPEWGDKLGQIDYVAYDGVGSFSLDELAQLNRTPEISEYVVFGEDESTLKIDDVRNEETLLELNQNGIKISGPIAVNGVALPATARPSITLTDVSDPVEILVSLCEALHNAGIIEFTDDRT